MSFFNELKRRNVFRVGIAYLVVAWLIGQVLDLVLANFGTPEWVMKTTLILLAAGFPICLLFAWAFELTPEGIRKESELADSGTTVRQSGRNLNYVIIGALVLAVIYLGVFKEPVNTIAQASIQTLTSRPAVVVLPFTNNSGDASQDFLAFGATDELIGGLQRNKAFPVVSRNAALDYRDTELSAIEFAKNLGASYLVEGSVNVVDGGIHILASLSNSEGNQLWSERYQLESGKTELFDVTDVLVWKIASAVLESEIQRVQRTDRPSKDAWEHYIRGLEVVLDYKPEKYEAARQHLDQATQIAPDMAEAWWAIGELEAINYMTRPMAEDTNLDELYTIIAYFRKSHNLSPFYAAACGCLGYMLIAVDQLDEAAAVFSEALEANPMSADLRLDYSTFLLWHGRYDEAMENTDLVLKLGALREDRAGVWINRSVIALAKGDRSGALEAVNRANFIKRDTYYAPAAVALLFVLGEEQNAARLMNDMREIFPAMVPENPLFYVLLKPIDDILARERESSENDGPENVEEIYAMLNEMDDAETIND